MWPCNQLATSPGFPPAVAQWLLAEVPAVECRVEQVLKMDSYSFRKPVWLNTKGFFKFKRFGFSDWIWSRCWPDERRLIWPAVTLWWERRSLVRSLAQREQRGCCWSSRRWDLPTSRLGDEKHERRWQVHPSASQSPDGEIVSWNATARRRSVGELALPWHVFSLASRAARAPNFGPHTEMEPAAQRLYVSGARRCASFPMRWLCLYPNCRLLSFSRRAHSLPSLLTCVKRPALWIPPHARSSWSEDFFFPLVSLECT